jgi:hypothetical protein
MTIAHYISQLLYRYQCVTVPSFGAFLTETTTAKIQESNQTFYPPKKVIFFNAVLKNNDGLLANHIALSEKITYDAAVNAIEKEVHLWKSQLENDTFLTIKNIGDFRLNEENNLVFNASNNLNYLVDSFGMSSFVSPVIKREEYKKQVEELEEVAPIQFTPERRASNSYLKYAAVLLVSLGAAGFGYKNYIENVSRTETLMVQAEVQKEVQNKIQEATFFIESPVLSITDTVTVAETPAVKTYPFHIMAGAFRKEKYAEKALKELKAQGYNARILEKNNHGLIPVVYGSFATYTEAQYKMKQIQDSINKDAWLFIEEQ